jgi:hypothetical protein
MPGLLQEARYMKKYIKKMQIKKMEGSAGLTFQFAPTTKIQKGITIPKEQQYI